MPRRGSLGCDRLPGKVLLLFGAAQGRFSLAPLCKGGCQPVRLTGGLCVPGWLTIPPPRKLGTSLYTREAFSPSARRGRRTNKRPQSRWKQANGSPSPTKNPENRADLFSGCIDHVSQWAAFPVISYTVIRQRAVAGIQEAKSDRISGWSSGIS